jgi:ubiquitin fusion degradation protein 1
MNTFLHSYKVFSPAMVGKPELERGNKIILPDSALGELSRMQVSYPMTFMITNPELGIKTYVGSLEFTAHENTCNIPLWMMDLLCCGEGSEVIVRNVNLRKGTYIKF